MLPYRFGLPFDQDEGGQAQAVVSALWVAESPQPDEDGMRTDVLSAASGAAHGLLSLHVSGLSVLPALGFGRPGDVFHRGSAALTSAVEATTFQ